MDKTHEQLGAEAFYKLILIEVSDLEYDVKSDGRTLKTQSKGKIKFQAPKLPNILPTALAIYIYNKIIYFQ